MKTIGITGGVGCGKSTVLDYLAAQYKCVILKADEEAMKMELPGGPLYEPVVKLLEEAKRDGDGPLFPDSSGGINPAIAGKGDPKGNGSVLKDAPGIPFDRKEAARRMYRDEALREKINDLVHPAVVKHILEAIADARKAGAFDYFFVEAALLIENGFDKLLDEMWYIYCREDIRRVRLKESRGYTDKKIDRILASQLSEEQFRAHCQVVIDNSGSPEATHLEIDAALGVVQ